MSRGRRALAMVTGSLAVLLLGLVVSVAARSLPGSAGDESTLELGLGDGFDPTPALAWILLILAIVGALLYAAGLKRKARPAAEGRKRNLLLLVIGLVVFALILRWIRPLAGSWLQPTPPTAGPAIDVPVQDPGPSGSSVWVFSLLLAAVLAAAMTRVGLSIMAERSSTTSGTLDDLPPGPKPTAALPEPLPLGSDPRSRVIDAYLAFESGLTAAGILRGGAETTGHHARRAAEQLHLDPDLVRSLVEHHSTARYGDSDSTESEARSAEVASSTLREEIGA